MTDLHSLVAQLADELEAQSKLTCWQGQYPHCTNEGCKHRVALIAQARQALESEKP